jgi:hypothetical protein
VTACRPAEPPCKGPCGLIRQERSKQPTTWLASINDGYLGEYFDRPTAMARVEDTMEHNMKLVLEDWEMYRVNKAQRTA